MTRIWREDIEERLYEIERSIKKVIDSLLTNAEMQSTSPSIEDRLERIEILLGDALDLENEFSTINRIFDKLNTLSEDVDNLLCGLNDLRGSFALVEAELEKRSNETTPVRRKKKTPLVLVHE